MPISARSKNPSALEALESRLLLDATTPFGATNPLAPFTDSHGDTVTVVLSGPGSGGITQPIAGALDPSSIVLTGTTSASSLTIKVVPPKGHVGMMTLGGLTIAGSLKSLIAPLVTLTGVMTATGNVGTVTLGDVDSGAQIKLDTDPLTVFAKAPTTSITLGSVTDGLIDTGAVSITKLTLKNWTDTLTPTDLTAPDITAPQIGTLTSSTGEFQAEMVVTGAGVVKGASLGSVTVQNLYQSDWDVTGSIGKITVAGTATDSDIRASLNVTSITVGAVSDSHFLAGIKAGVTNPSSIGQFVNDSLISTVTVKGLKLAKGQTQGTLVDQTTFAANRVGTVSLQNVSSGSVFAHYTAAKTEIKKITIKDLSTNQTLTYAVGVWKSGSKVVGAPATFAANRISAVDGPPVVNKSVAQTIDPFTGLPYAAANLDPSNGDGSGSLSPTNAYEGRSVMLSVVASSTLGLTYSWAQTGGKSVGTITNANAANATFVVPTIDLANDHAADLLMKFTVTITDSNNQVVTKDVYVRARLLGDVNFDDMVQTGLGQPDRVGISTATNGPDYERYDLNGDDTVNSSDLDIAKANNGESVLP